MKKIIFVFFITVIAYHNSMAARTAVRGGYVKSAETSYIIRDVSVLDPRKK